jgi:Regulator of chromosome condensation (RCC1) repeat
VRFGSSLVLVLTLCSATAAAVASCSSDDDPDDITVVDSGVEGSAPDVTTTDAGLDDVAPPPRDAAPFDGGPRPVACASSPCATSLVTTNHSFTDEGFCALLEDGTVACWGANDVGQLGRGDDAEPSGSATPARVAGLQNIVQLVQTCALDTNGAVWCWGKGAYLQNDAGDVTTESVPVKLPLPPATSVSVTSEVGCALVGDGVQCWGSNARAQIAPFDSAPGSATLGPTAIVLPAGAPIRSVTVGEATFVLRSDGTLMSWGGNPPLARASSLNPDPSPKPVGLDGVSSLDLLSRKACATSEGIGYCWGSAGGELDRVLPEPVVTREPIVQIATTRGGAWRWCAVGASGDVYCWGDNSSGQAGDGTKLYAYEAVRVKGLPAAAAEVRTTANATCALLTNGKVYCWGTNYYGQLGNGKFKVPSLVPQEVVLP